MAERKLDSREFKHIYAQTVVLPILFSVLLCVGFTFQIMSLLSANSKVRISDEILAQSAETLRYIVDAETGLRGFLLGRKEEFLDPYRIANVRIAQAFSQMKQLTRGNEQSAQLIRGIQKNYNDWHELADQEIEAARVHSGTQPIGQLLARKVLMDSIRGQFSTLDTDETLRRKENWQEAESSSRMTLALSLAGGILVGILLALFGSLQVHRLSRNYTGMIRSLGESNEHLESEVLRRTADLTTVNKELESFCYSVSHDLRAPLRGIDGFSQVMVEEYSDKVDDVGRKYLKFIRQGVQKMGILIDDLLGLSRISRNEMRSEIFDVSRVAGEVMEEIRSSNPERKLKFTNLPPTQIRGDSGFLRIALQNLLSNAWKFTAKKEQSEIDFGIRQVEGRPTFFVKDNGVGFDMRYYDKLFQAFQRLHSAEAFEGSGIGLATVKRVIQRHGGTIWAESRIGEGTTFYFTIGTSAIKEVEYASQTQALHSAH